MSTSWKRLLELWPILLIAGIFLALTWGTSLGDLPNLYLGRTKTENIDQTINMTGIPTIEIENMVGAVTISRNEGANVEIHIVKKAATSALLRTLRVEVLQDADKISVRTTGISVHGGPAGGNSRSVTYKISVPAQTNVVRVRTFTKASPITITGIAGDLDLHTEYSAITVRDYHGEVIAETFDGPIDITEGLGPVHIRRGVSVPPP